MVGNLLPRGKLLKLEEDYIREVCKEITHHRPDVVITEKGLSDLAMHFLTKAGVSAIRRLRKTDNNRIARATGATIVHRRVAILKELPAAPPSPSLLRHDAYKCICCKDIEPWKGSVDNGCRQALANEPSVQLSKSVLGAVMTGILKAVLSMHRRAADSNTAHAGLRRSRTATSAPGQGCLRFRRLGMNFLPSLLTARTPRPAQSCCGERQRMF